MYERCWLCKGPLNSFNKHSGGLCHVHKTVPIYILFSLLNSHSLKVEVIPDIKGNDRQLIDELYDEAEGRYRLFKVEVDIRDYHKIWLFQQGVNNTDEFRNMFALSGFQGDHYEDTFFVQIPTVIVKILLENPRLYEELRIFMRK